MTEDDLKKLFGWRHERPGDVFMETLKRDGLVVAPGVYDAMGGHLVNQNYQELKAKGESCTFNAVYLGHWSTSAMLLRKPDLGFVSLDFVSQIAKWTVASAYPLPVIFDIETGFGNATTITQTIQRCDEIGVAVIHLEDQEDSGTVARRCGNLGGKWCAPPDNQVAKIRSSLEVLRALNSSVRLMVRTDAITAANGSFEDAVERGKRYMSVDIQGWRPTILWADAMYDPRHIDKWVEVFRKFDPQIILGINYSPNRDWTPTIYRQKFGQAPPTYEDLYLHGQGFRVIWHTILQARADMESSYNIIRQMAKFGAEALWQLHERQRQHPVGDAQAMSGAREWQAFDQHIGGNEAVERYRRSEGYQDQTKKTD